MIRIKRTYDPPARGDGWRVLVERLWPRGMKKESLAADAWLKDVAPSTALRKWFDHRVDRWEEFQRRYREELKQNSDAWRPILDASRRRTVTLLYSAHDPSHNGALVLQDYLSKRGTKRRPAQFRPAVRTSSPKLAGQVAGGRRKQATDQGPESTRVTASRRSDSGPAR
jgi:uncharacterized protein YeaO (DUF488 family)